MSMSEQQAWVLRYVLTLYRRIEHRGTHSQRNHLRWWGVPWKPWDGKPNASERASMSRALRRLEHRGLIKRRNHVSDTTDGLAPRTLDVQLTDEGRRVAERLTKEKIQVVNRQNATGSSTPPVNTVPPVAMLTA